LPSPSSDETKKAVALVWLHFFFLLMIVQAAAAAAATIPADHHQQQISNHTTSTTPLKLVYGGFPRDGTHTLAAQEGADQAIWASIRATRGTHIRKIRKMVLLLADYYSGRPRTVACRRP